MLLSHSYRQLAEIWSYCRYLQKLQMGKLSKLTLVEFVKFAESIA